MTAFKSPLDPNVLLRLRKPLNGVCPLTYTYCNLLQNIKTGKANWGKELNKYAERVNHK